jgi:hypothetical protein
MLNKYEEKIKRQMEEKVMRFELSINQGEKVWGCSTHAIEQFIERNKFLTKSDFNHAMDTLVTMMRKAVFICYEARDKVAEIYTYGKWVFIAKESTIVTVYEKKGSKYEKRIA